MEKYIILIKDTDINTMKKVKFLFNQLFSIEFNFSFSYKMRWSLYKLYSNNVEKNIITR